MKPLSASVALALLCALPFLTGCQSRQESNRYTAIRVSNYRSETIAEYIARGSVRSGDGGLSIHAIERRTYEPYPHYQRYPLGWETTVVGPRVHHWRTSKPAWLDEAALDSAEGYAK